MIYAINDAKWEKSKIARRFVLWWIGLVSPRSRVRSLDNSEIASQMFPSNRRAVGIAEANEQLFQEFLGYKLLYDQLNDDNLTKYYKNYMTIPISRHMFLQGLADSLSQGKNAEVVLFSDAIGDLPENKNESSEESCVVLPWVVLNFLRFQEFISVWILKAALFLCPLYLLFRHLKNGIAKRPGQKGKVVIPVIWGIPEDGAKLVAAGVVRFVDDGYLYGDRFSIGDVLHVFGDWKFSPDDKKIFRERMDRKKIPYADRQEFGITPRLFFLTLKITAAIALKIFQKDESCFLRKELWRATMKGIYHYLLKNYEIDNIDCKAELVRNDYNSGHVIATMVANRHGRKRVGISHAATSFDSPQMCFVHFDRYVVYCDLYARTFMPFWDGIKLEKTGRETIDSVVREREKREEHAIRIEKLYGKRQWTVTILFPGVSEACLLKQWDEIYAGLVKFRDYPLDAHVFLRFRRMNDVLKMPHMNRFLSLPKNDSRLIVQHENFNTHELLATSDLVIAGNASFGINEALVAGIPVFTFAYTVKEELYFPDYGKDFILHSSDDLLKTFGGLATAFRGFDCDWKRLRKDADYFHDGKNSSRLAEVVYDVLQESEKPNEQAQSIPLLKKRKSSA